MNKAQELTQKMYRVLEFRDSSQKLPSITIQNEKLDMAVSLIRNWLMKIKEMYGYKSPEADRASLLIKPIMNLFHNGFLSTITVGKNINFSMNFPTDIDSNFILSIKVNVGKGLSLGQRRSAKWFAQPLSTSGEERVKNSLDYFSGLFLKELEAGFSDSNLFPGIDSHIDYKGEGHYGVISYSGIIQE